MTADMKNDIQLLDEPRAAEPRQIAPTPMQTPGDLLTLAVQQGANLDRLEQLMRLKREWEEAEARKAYFAAVARFKATAVRVLRGTKITDGPLKGKRYADLHAWVSAVTPALSAQGLSHAWSITRDEKDLIEVACTLRHELGFSETVRFSGPPDVGPGRNLIQARISTLSYLERATLKAITGLSEEGDDDDGAGGQRQEPDPELQAVIDRGDAAAAKGTKAFGDWFESLTPKGRAALRDRLADWRTTAKEFDLAHEEPKRPAATRDFVDDMERAERRPR